LSRLNISDDGSHCAVCGTVNSKSGCVGYTGDPTWIFVIPDSTIYTQENDAITLSDCGGGVDKAKPARAVDYRHDKPMP
jgi:hypothetical protein